MHLIGTYYCELGNRWRIETREVYSTMNRTLRRVIILGTPAVLGILDIFHPTFTGDVFSSISSRLNWWIILHIIQLPLFCLLALSVYLLLDKVQGRWATLSRVALGIFVAFYPALDAILGVGTGILAIYAKETVNIVQASVQAAIDNYFASNIVTLVGALGGFAWAVAILLAVLALSQPVRSRWLMIITVVLAALAVFYYQLIHLNVIPEVLSVTNLSRLVLLLAIAVGLLARPHLATGLLVMAAFLFSVDHAPPTGPVALACYFVAALQLEFFPENAPLVKQDAVSTEKDVMSANGDGVPTDGVVSQEEIVREKDVVSDPS